MKKSIFFVAAVCTYSLLHSQEDSIKSLEPVIVTATKTELKQSQTGKVVTVIDKAILKNNVGKSLTEVLNTQTGLFIAGANNSPGANQDVYLRGAATGNTLILIDGIPLQDPSQISGAYDLNNIQVSQIERVEILKGSQSTLWGSDAVAGVINIITKKGGNKSFTPTATVAYGSYNTLRLNAGVNGSLDKLSYNVLYSHTGTKGFSAAKDTTGNANFDKDGLKQHNLQANVGYTFSPFFSAHYSANYGTYKADADAGAYTDDRDYRIENRNMVNNISFRYARNNVSLNLSQSIINSKRAYTDDSTHVPASAFAKWSFGEYKAQSIVTDLYGNFKLGKHASLLGGFQYLSQNTDQTYKSISDFGPYESYLSGDSANISNYSLYTSFLLTDLNGFNNEMGVRFNRHSIYGNNATFSFNPSYRIDNSTKVFLNISSGYHIPSLYQLYSEYGNKDLKPESSLNYELGFEVTNADNTNRFRIVGFKRDIKNMFAFYYNASTFESRYINRDKQNDYGFELESRTAIGKKGSWINNLTYVDGRGEIDDVKLNNLYRRPNFTFNSSLSLEPVDGLTIIPSFRFVGNRLKAPSDVSTNPIPHYYSIDFYSSYYFGKGISVFLDLRNITDQQYVDVPGYNSRRFNFMTGVHFNL